jgi:hypothetical protein
LMGARIPRGLILPALLLEDWVALSTTLSGQA